MASEDEQSRKSEEAHKPLKEGERIVAPSRRPDGTLRKPIRIRAGYVPQEEVAIYQSRGALWKKQMAELASTPPGYDPVPEAKPKTKSSKRNEKKKEKRQQAALDKQRDQEFAVDKDRMVPAESDSTASLTCQMNELSVSDISSSPVDSAEATESNSSLSNEDKRIRALKKKIRLSEAQLHKADANDKNSSIMAEKLEKLDAWKEELARLEFK